MKIRVLSIAAAVLAIAVWDDVGDASAQGLRRAGPAQFIMQQFAPARAPRFVEPYRTVADEQGEMVPTPEGAAPYVQRDAWEETDGGYMPDGSPCCEDDCGACSSGGIDWCGVNQGPCFGGMWGRFDYLLWWGRGTALVPLVTTSSQSSLGVLSAADTVIVLGNDRVDNDSRSGGRIDFGAWIDPEQTVGVGGNFLSVESAGSIFDLFSLGDPLLARPFFNIDTGMDDSQVVAASGISYGWINVQTKNNFLGAEAYVRESLMRNRRSRIDLIYGYRFARMDESIVIRDSTVSIDPGGSIPIGTVIAGRDLFDTNNTFHGGTLGLQFGEERGFITWNVLAKVSLGNARQDATVDGDTIVTVPGFAPVVSQGSLYALPTNIGTYHRDRFAVIPEVDLNLGYRVTALVDGPLRLHVPAVEPRGAGGRSRSTRRSIRRRSAAAWSGPPGRSSSSATATTGCRASTSGWSAGTKREGVGSLFRPSRSLSGKSWAEKDSRPLLVSYPRRREANNSVLLMASGFRPFSPKLLFSNRDPASRCAAN